MIQDRIDEVLREEGWSFYANYSGRGMFGDTCLGVVHPSTDSFRAVSALVDALEDEGLADAAETIRSGNARTDSMGRDQITYWPSLSSEVLNV